MKLTKMNKKYIIALLFLAVAILGAWGLKHNYTRQDNPVPSASQEYINLEPPTEEEKEAGNNVEVKQDSNQPSGDTKNNPETTSPSSASVTIIDASVYGDQVEVRAFVSKVVAEGTCTYTFSSPGKTFTKSNPAEPDATTTNCTTLNFSKSELSDSTDWTVKVKYENTQKTISGVNESRLNL